MGGIQMTMEDIEHKLLMDRNLRELMCCADKLEYDGLREFIGYLEKESRQKCLNII